MAGVRPQKELAADLLGASDQTRMSSMYAQYLIERTDDHIIEDERGFVTYRYLNEKQCYIVDIFVLPEHRDMGVASSLADRVAAEARSLGRTELVGTVIPSAKAATASLMVLLAYGMVLDSATVNLIAMKKGI